MKIVKPILSFVLCACILLSACQSTPPAQKPSDTGYPVENPQKQPTPNAYPADGQSLDSIESQKGALAYIADQQVSEAQLKQISDANNALALKLYTQLNKGDTNLLYSPYSIFQALMMVYAGAQGSTKSQMSTTLNLPADDNQLHTALNSLNQSLTRRPEFASAEEQPLQLSIANALWGQKDAHFEQSFLDTLSSNYDAGMNLIDFSKPEEARALINLWIAAQTNDKIREMIPSGLLNQMTRLVITNAVHFKGAWINRFDASQTTRAPFYLTKGNTQEVDMMHDNSTRALLVEDAFTAVKLPYEGGNYSMAIIMPKDSSFADFAKGLTDSKLAHILQGLNENYTMVNLSMPKFKFEASFDLGETLKGLGMSDAFDSQRADFSGISGKKDLYIANVLHKAFIEVNEEGTEATASTMIGMNTTSMPGEPVSLIIDHPFLFVIYQEGSNAILFMGQVVAP